MAGIDEAGLTSVTHPSVYSYNDEFPPLTTLFTYAPECTDHWVLSGGSHDETVYSAGIFGTHWQSCQPSYGSSIYSPGICPSGYAINTVTELGTSAATGGSDDWKMWQALCCPADFKLLPGQICSSYLRSRRTVYRPALSFISTSYTVGGTVISSIRTSSDFDATFNTTVISYATMYARAIEVWWQASDLSAFEPEYASALGVRLKIPFSATASASITAQTASPSSISRVPGPTATTANGASSPDSGLEATSPSGLSAGAKAGVSVVAVAGFAIFAVIAFLLFARHRRRNTRLDEVPELDRTKADAPELVQLRSPGA